MIQPYSRLLVTGAALALAVAAVSGASAPVDDWKISGPFGGTVTSIAVDLKEPKTVFAGGRNSLLYESQDAGASWHTLNLPRRNFGEVTSILIDPADSQHILAGMIATEHPGIFESVDAGKTWSQVKGVDDVSVRALAAAASDPTHFVAGTLRGVMLSTDSGKTWARISDPENEEMQGITAVAIDPKDPNVIYAGTPHLPWRTKDGGKTWESIHSGMIDDSDVFSIYIDPKMPQDVFASACSGIYSTTDRGDLWHKLLGIPNTSRRTHVIRADPEQAGTIYAGTTLGLFKTTNQGTSWKSVNSDQVNAIAFDPAQPKSMYLALEYQGIGKSDDSGETIKLIDNGFVNRRISAVTTSGKRLIAVEAQEGDTTGVFSSTDRGETWQSMARARGLEGAHMRSIVGMPSEDRILLGSTPRQIFKSIDAGQTWKPMPIHLQIIIEPKTPPRPSTNRTTSAKRTGPSKAVIRTPKPIVRIKEVIAQEISSLYVTRSGTKDVLYVATDLGLLRSYDMGERWSLLELPGTIAVNGLFVSPAADGRMVARAAGGLYLSKDFGDHWDRISSPKPTSEINEIALPLNAASSILMATWGGLFSSPDSGVTWTVALNGIPVSTVNSVIYSAADAGVAYAVEYGQLYQSKDSGASWTSLSTGLQTPHIRQLWIPEKSSDRLYAITNDIGILFRNGAVIR